MNRINQRIFIKRTSQGLAGLAVAPATLAKPLDQEEPSAKPTTKPVATFSIVGFNPLTGDLGVAVQSKFFAVGRVVPWAKAGVGAIATQSYANVSYGPDGLERLAKGQTAGESGTALSRRPRDSGIGLSPRKLRSRTPTGGPQRSCWWRGATGRSPPP